MNLENIIRSAITPVVPKVAISLNIFNNVTVDDSGIVTPTYTLIENIMAQVQLEYNQKLIDKAYFNQNSIYKRFYIQSTDLTGLNRQLSTGGDYIIMDNLFYKIVEVNENFRTGWVHVVGNETTSEKVG